MNGIFTSGTGLLDSMICLSLLHQCAKSAGKPSVRTETVGCQWNTWFAN